MKNLSTLIFCLSIFSNLFAQNATPGACGSGGKNPVPMNGSGSLGFTYSNNACGLNYVQASQLIQTRSAAFSFNANGTGLPTTLAISGLPSCVTIVRAYVWYLVSYIGGAPQASSVDITNPVPATSNYAATNIGTDQGKCWGETGTVNYRADVTAAITGNGNYGINIQGITGSGGNFPNWYDQIDGLTLMIIYQDNGASYQGSIVIWDGDMTGVGNTYTQTMTGVNACGNSTAGNAFLIVSDMQDNVNGNMHPSTLNGTTITTFPNDFYNFDVTNTTVTAGQATSAFGTDGLGSDCFDWAVMGLYYQTTTCTTCTPSAVSLTVTPTPSTCNAPNGGATATASTSNPPLTYLWSPGGQTTTSISNLAAGTYTCTVTSAVGCSTVQTFTITTSVGPAVTFTTTPSICTSTNGSASLTASGGTAPYNYNWAITPANTTTTATGLASGTYSVVVGDASGCSATYTVNVPQTTNTFVITPAQTNAKCFGSSDGSCTATPSGGTAPYAHIWSTSQTTPSVSNLAAGNYTVLVTDANGCTQTAAFTITQPTVLSATASVLNNASCFGTSDGSAIANGAGGTAPYGYSWNSAPVQNTQTANNLPAGTYSVIVTDANGCTTPSSATITQPTAINLSETTTMASCGQSDGTATVSATGGTGAYSYLWTGVNPAQTTQTLNNVPAGTYIAVVTDANGCNSNLSVTVPGGSPPTAMFTNNPDVVDLLEATIAFFDLSTNATTWYWDFGDPNDPTTSSLENPSHTYTDTGVYCITLIVTDPGGVCQDTTVHCIRVESPFTFYVPNAFTPNGDIHNQFFCGEGTYIKEFRMWIYDRWGNEIWSCYTMGEPQLAPDCLWDGKVDPGGIDLSGGSNRLAQEDIYIWKVELTDANSKPHKYMGHVSMIK